MFQHLACRFALLCSLFPFVVLSQSEGESEAIELYPAHIEVRVGQVGDSFYRVMMDDYEEPFISISNAAFSLLEMNGQCDENGYCEIYLPQDVGRESPPYIVDSEQALCFRDDNNIQSIKFEVIDSETYIHWYSLQACIPAKIRWDIDDYRLTVSPEFSSLTELEAVISKIKNESRKKAEELKRASNTPVIEPLATVGLATRVAASVYHDSETGGDVYAISDTILSTEHSLSRLSIDSREDNPIVYYNIAVEAHEGEGSLEIGHVLLDGSVFTVNQTLEDGLYYTNRKRQPEFGNLQLERTTQPNISIDVLVNGIYQTTYRSDEFGRFVVEEENISPGDTIKFRYYLSKGVWQEEEITVAGLEDAFLPRNEWGVQVVGNEGADRAGAVSLEYGLADYFTVGSAFMRQHGKDLIGFQGRYLPAHWLAGHIGWLPEFNRFPMEFDILINGDQSASIELNKTDELDLESMEYDVFKYNLSLANLTAFLTVRDDDDELSVEPKLNSKVARNLFVSYAGDYRYTKASHQDDYLHTIGLAKSGFSDTSWNISGTVDGSGHHERTELSLRNACKECLLDPLEVFQELTTNVSARYQKQEISFTASLEARVNPYLLFKLEGTEDRYGVEMTTEFGAKTYFDESIGEFVEWNRYNHSKLTGIVYDHHKQPIQGVSLQILDQRAVSDTKGRFEFSSVPARDNLPIYIDEGALDLNLTPIQNPVFVNTKQVGLTHAHIEMVVSFGVDGMVEGDLENSAYLHFKHIQKGTEYSSEIESDGFYMVEGLIAGKYIVTLDMGDKRYVQGADLDGDFWVSDLTFNLIDFHKVY
ncbi:carboxypeptidase-like regulatory domain-containing protein [Vibrio sp. 10N.247.311.51]|uniref:carboxypeptidase-like regulatory domain-containing protein n=1 Tax=Vibrio sp. 10N.247.311.51 TaxID=3229996 RepID=UPI0035516F2F